MGSTLVADLERQVRDRLKELEPLVEEAAELRQLLTKLEDSRSAERGSRQSRGASAGGSGRGSRQSRGAATAGSGRRGRPQGSATGGRRAMALRLVVERPGITVADLAGEMGIGTTYLYRVMPSLERDGAVRKVGAGYEPASR